MMKWFDGSIPAAIQLAKNKKSLFIVFVTGDDEPSRETAKAWEDEAVSQLSLTSNCVGLKLDAKSQVGIQFAQIYPVMIVPSVFFIAPETGLPLEVSMGQVDAGQLLEKFNKALQMQKPTSPSASASGGASVAAAAPVAVETAAEAPPEASGGVHSASGNPQTSGAATFNDEEPEDPDDALREGETLEERQARLLKKLAEKRERKAQQEEEDEKRREMERRKLGQETQKFRQWKEEMEKKEFSNSYKKEKEEQKRALEKVRADLERDRQERAERYKQDKELQGEKIERAKKARLEAEAKKLDQENATKRESSRVQFRMPDGSSITNVFSSADTLSIARSFIQEKLNNKPVTLSTTYPKRTFLESDMASTLLDLELAPSSVLIVLPGASRGHRRVTAAESDSTSFLWILLAPLLALWNFIYNFLFPAVPPPVSRPDNQNVEPRATTPDAGSRNTQQQPRSQGLRNRKDGNINRLTADDEDDESATWNGNSTQQM